MLQSFHSWKLRRLHRAGAEKHRMCLSALHLRHKVLRGTRGVTQIPQVNQEQGESIMTELDKLTEQFDGLLNGIREKYSLEEWRYAYRKVIYSGAMKIFKEFPVVIIGPPPPPPQQEQKGGAVGSGPEFMRNPPPITVLGERPPYRPSCTILLAACIALGNCPPPST
jgi:hypothetical protein